MRIITKPEEMYAAIKKLKLKNKRIGFVPTMGALHEGHISLIKKARKENHIVVVSIFINPTQFGPGEDYLTYPRTIKLDSTVCRKEKVDILFNPTARSLYPEDYLTYTEVIELSKLLCGKYRPVHFLGVTTIVLKLFKHILKS